jgi:hypothetical protein
VLSDSHLLLAQQYALPLLKQSSQSLPPRKLAADALLTKSANPGTTIARGAEGTQLRTRMCVLLQLYV